MAFKMDSPICTCNTPNLFIARNKAMNRLGDGKK